ncbi:gamma-glutamyl hydrolase A-like [Clytia hemisphaerica]|uniref:folate gamma-glutamyl hydrolase n=1 Tax=Clytia hemisphaerica TaxID=252671 RepID=A0A7M5URR9_9CNID|eukprot:TCONS_00020994-protein
MHWQTCFYAIFLIWCISLLPGNKSEDLKRKKRESKKSNGYPNLSSFPTNFFTETYKKFVNNRPIIGIIPMPMDGDKLLVENPTAYLKEYFGGSFVKLIEMGGGKAIPLTEDLMFNKRKLRKLLKSINGVLIPGGDGDLADSGFSIISQEVVEYSRKQAKKGIPYPVLGICRGSQMIMQLGSEEEILRPSDSSNLTLPLTLTKDARDSQIFGHATEDLLRVVQEKPITFNAHIYSVLYETFEQHPELQKQFRVTSTNFDRRGIKFISTYEDKFAPIFGLQWHPEKSLFVHNPVQAVDHSIFAIAVAQYISNVFMGFARQNPNQFKTRREEEKHLIYNTLPLYVGNVTETPYEQIYMFPLFSPKLVNRKVKIPLQR